MGTSIGPRLVKNGLILHLDVANRKSFLPSAGSPSIINTAAWALGTGGVTGYGMNGDTLENERIVDTDPWGNQNIVWGTYPSGNNQGDGGWNTSYFPADRTKLHRFSVWVRRTSVTTGGTFYFGLYTNGTGNTYHLADGASNTNPYWDHRGIAWFTQNEWYLVVGHLFPYGHLGTTAHPDSGYYRRATGKTKAGSLAGGVPNDVRFPSDATSVVSRVYHYYCADSTSRLQFAYPRIDVVDGSEPSILELLNNSSGMLKDLSGQGNHHTLAGYYVPSSPSPNKFTLNGTSHGFQRNGALAGVSSACTVALWYATTDTQELWVRGSQDNGTYLSASAGNNYYHSNVGAPTNYVDLAVCTRPDSPINYRDGSFHMWEAKNVDFSPWTYFDWFSYPGGWYLAGDAATILVYNRVLTADESAQNLQAFRSRFL